MSKFLMLGDNIVINSSKLIKTPRMRALEKVLGLDENSYAIRQ